VSETTEMILRMTVMPDLVSEATAEMWRALGDSLNSDWNVLAADLEWSCRGTAAHVADDLFSYASQVLAQPLDNYLPIEATVDVEATPEDLLRSVAMCGELLRLAAASAPRDVRAWHPYGTSDPEGFAAMGIVEVLVHTHDIAGGLGVEWGPPRELCAPVLLRLFPNAPQGVPSEVLLWATGRAELGDRPRLADWRWDSSVRR
jgi:hypothetical protein